MARPAKRAAAEKQTPENAAATQGLRDAVAFVGQAQKDGGSIHQTHMMLANKWLWAFDGIIAAAHPVPDENVACPHGSRFLDALKRVGAGLSMTQTDAHSLIIASQKFRAIVPCVTFNDMPAVAPDRMVGQCDDKLRVSLGVAGRFSKESAPRVIEASLLLSAYMVTGTNGHVMIQHQHGIDMPTLVLPKTAATLLAKQTKKLCGFGFSQSTVTFYYEDGAWIRSQLYVDPWPPLDRIWQGFNVEHMAKLPADFFTAVASVASFNEVDSRAYFSKDMVSSHRETDRERAGATYTVKGLVADCCLNPDYIVPLKDVVTDGNLSEVTQGEARGVFFMGPSCRVAVAMIGRDRASEPQQVSNDPAAPPPRASNPAPAAAPVARMDDTAARRRREAEAQMLAEAAGIKTTAGGWSVPIDDPDIPF